jgi:hypothetical protein
VWSFSAPQRAAPSGRRGTRGKDLAALFFGVVPAASFLLSAQLACRFLCLLHYCRRNGDNRPIPLVVLLSNISHSYFFVARFFQCVYLARGKYKQISNSCPTPGGEIQTRSDLMAESPSKPRSRTSSFSSAFDSVSDFFPAVSISRSLWRRPQEHDDPEEEEHSRGVTSPQEQHRHEEWYELFYDLVFVAAAIQMGNLLKYHLSYTNVFTTTLLFTVMRATWDHLTLYQNRYDTKDLLHHLFYMIESMTAFAMCLSLGMEGHEWDKENNVAPFAVSAAISRIMQVLMYSQILKQSKKHTMYVKAVSTAQRVSAALFVASAIWGRTGWHYVYYWVAAVVVERPLVHVTVFFCLPSSSNSVYRVPQHTSHLIHRQVLHAIQATEE